MDTTNEVLGGACWRRRFLRGPRGAVGLCLGLLLAGAGVAQPQPAPVVDEPLGARYSLGMTLWHLGHNASSIRRFHAFVKDRGLTPETLLPTAKQKPPGTLTRVLVEPELLDVERRNGWRVEGEAITSGATDAGPTVSVPVRVPTAGCYRLWVRYFANLNARGVTSLKIYLAGQQQRGPICQPDEFYDQPAVGQAGYVWKDMIVDLPAGDLVIQLGHVTRWWHGGGGYDLRRVDCLYATDELWAEPPTDEARQAIRAAAPVGIQWTATAPLTDLEDWRWWQLRPVAWEDAADQPQLFDLSRQFWRGIIDELERKEYDENAKPDYRAPERQVVYHETWNMVANPVRARRQIDVLTADISRQPLKYHYVWHDVGSNVPGLRAEGGYDADGPDAKYGGWYGGPGRLEASYGSPTGTVTTRVPVTAPGRYAVWVLSNPTNLGYTAPWFGKVSIGGREQFTYHHQGKIPSVWMKMGEVAVERPDEVQVAFILDGAGAGGTYRRIYALFLVDDLSLTPSGTVRPPWTLEMYRERAARAGSGPTDQLLLWLAANPYRPLSQEVWADQVTAGDGWPDEPVSGTVRTQSLLMAGDANRAVQVGLRNLTDAPLTLDVHASPLTGAAGVFPQAITWRAEAFVPYGGDRQAWTPFFLLRRANITVPPLNIAGVWVTVDTHGVPPGEYQAQVTFRAPDRPAQNVDLHVRVSAVKPQPRRPVLVDGWTLPHEGEAYLRDFVEHGVNVWPGEMSKADMQRWGIRQLRLSCGSAADVPAWLARLQSLGLDYGDYFVGILDEPGGTTPEALKPFLDVARAIRAHDPRVRICFNPSEAAQLATFQVLAPYCDVWCPYSLHVLSPYFGNPEKKQIYLPKPWMWYTTPCLWDKTAREPGIRTVPSQPGNCVGVAFFALNYPWRDQWDTGYEHLNDASTMGAVPSRHGPVATIVWEQIREACQTADLAMLVRERLGAKTFDDIIDANLQRLVREGSSEELIAWLEQQPAQ